ncbi:MAG: DNA gyrase inhibitor YacG [Bryobacterales bacterium]|nr:DNA gyrase inhibitor YacG [Bryobacterales bacterium]
MSERKSIACPICKKAVYLGDAEFPFCSERCRLIDLGNWSSEEYRIPGPPTDSEMESLSRPEEKRPEDRPSEEWRRDD